jgi:DNA polymerase elongation subunit (family B)
MDNLIDVLAAQNKRILTLQLLLEALVDELIETKKLKESKLDERFVDKMNWANEQLDKARDEASMDYLKSQMFGGKMGEA